MVKKLGKFWRELEVHTLQFYTIKTLYFNGRCSNCLFFYISSGSFSTTQEIDSQINMKYTLHVTEICWQTCFWSVNPDFHKVKVIIFIDVISLKGMSPFSRIYKIYISRMIFNFFARITYSFKNCKSAQNLKFLAFVDFKISRIQ